MKTFLPLVCILLFSIARPLLVRAQNQVQVVQNGSATAAVSLEPTPSCVYDWVIDNPNIGLSPSGTGSIPSFTALNNTHNPITATITVTPKPTPARAYIPSQATGMVSVLDVATNTVIAKVRVGAKPYGVAISPDNSKVYVTNNADNTVSEIDAATNTVTRTFPVGSDPRGIAVSLDGKNIYVACHGDTGPSEFDICNIDRNLTTVIPPGAGKPNALALSPDGERVYTLSDVGGTAFPIKTINNTFDHPLFLLPLAGTDIRINSRANKMYEAILGGDLYFGGNPVPYHPTGIVYDFNTQSYYLINTPAGFSDGITTSPDGDLAYLTIPDANKVALVNTAVTVLNNNVPFSPQINSITVGTNPQGIATTPDGFIYVLNYGSNNISVLSPDRVNPMVIKTVSTGDDKPFALGDFITHNACTSSPFTITITVNPTPSAIITSGTPQHLTTPANIPCPSTSFHVSGTNLYDGIVVTAPNNFEVSEDDVNFGPTLLIGAGGDIPTTPLYVRLKGGLPVGNYTGGITLQSTNVADVTVTVNGTVTTAIPNITTTPVTGNIAACLGTASSSPHIQRFTVSGELLVDDVTATAPTGFEVSLFVDHGYGHSVIIPRSGNVVTNVTVYVRSSAAASGIINGNVTLTSAGAYNRTTAVYGEIDVPPTINNNIIHQTLNAGNTTTAINFSGSADSFIWHNDTPGIGLPQDGSGNINPFIASNTTGQTLTANITVTPVNAPLAYIANQDLGTVSVINTFNNQVSGNSIPVGDVPYGAAVSPDGSRVYVTNQNANTISVINTLTNSVISTIRTGNSPSGIAVSPDGSKLYVSSSGTGLVFVIYPTPNSGLNTSIIVGNLPLGIVASPDGNWVYVANRNSNTVSVISTAINAPIRTITVGTSPEFVALSPDGGTLYVTNYNNKSVSVINTQTYQTSTITVGNNPRGITVSPDGSKIYVTNWGDRTVSVIDAVTHAQSTVNVGQSPEGISVTPDGKFVYVANTDSRNMSVISTATNTVTSTIPLPGQPVSLGSFITPASGCIGTPITFQITVNPPISVITATGTLPALNTTYGTPSSSARFSVSGTGLTDGITVKPPTGFEVSTDGVVFMPSIVIGTGGTVNGTQVYLRLTATTVVGSYSGDIKLRSSGAPDAFVPTTNSTVNPALLTIKADDKTKEFKTANPVLTTTYAGFVNNEGVEQLTTLPTITTTADENSPAGQYPILASGAAAVNYTFNYVAGTLTVTAIEVPLVIPNTFTPNNDGINDTWVIKNLDTYQKYTVQIFNRNGESLFFSNKYSEPWDGRYKNRKLPTGTYYYVIDLYNGEKPVAGSITIIR